MRISDCSSDVCSSDLRAFFFAGSESLLASHWPVRDDVAAVLTVRLFEILRADPKLSRAEALQRVEREIRDDARDDPYLKSWSHPSAWAPFSLIGDVGRRSEEPTSALTSLMRKSY